MLPPSHRSFSLIMSQEFPSSAKFCETDAWALSSFSRKSEHSNLDFRRSHNSSVSLSGADEPSGASSPSLDTAPSASASKPVSPINSRSSLALLKHCLQGLPLHATPIVL
ncbi:hypothetical protein CsSME_00039375 [Camellia sinensis var. sinensis]